MMITIETKPETKTDLPRTNFNWVVRPASPAYFLDETTNDLAEELGAASKNRTFNTEQIPSVSPEDFEEIYKWFLS